MFGGFTIREIAFNLAELGDVMDIGVLRTTIMETGQWVDGDLYNGRIVLIANSYVLKMYLIIQGISLLWDDKIPIQYGSDYMKKQKIILRVGVEVAGT
jgi:small-conductance mechanosensitive channel